MGFFDYAKAANKYKGNELMLETIKRLMSFDEYHCLRNSSLLIGKKAAEAVPKAVEQYIGWMTVCNGGLLFDTTLLSVTELDKELDIEFSTLEEYNNAETYGEMELPEGYFIIGMRSYGDPICLSAADDRVYLWDCEEGDFTTIWNDFINFLADEVDTAIDLIANDDLDPIPLKMDGEDEE